ncbi:MAG TPA: AAA family ATPase [Allosphingosinicella sp.]|jgi:hypothetical protein
MTFQNITISGWRQFESINVDLHPRLTTITGANGAGKSTILRVLAQHFGFQNIMLATPAATKSGVFQYFAGVFRRKSQDLPHVPQPLGSISYSDGRTAKLMVPNAGGVQYNINVEGMSRVDGLFIPSHRPTSVYQQVANIPTNAITAEQAYQAYNQEVSNRFNNSHSQYSPTYRIKEAIISMATFGPGNLHVRPNRELERTFNEFVEVLRKVFPDTIGFKGLEVRIPDVVISTDTGDFVIDAASGGLMALVDLAWQIFLYSRGRNDFVAIIDEPENHLHPSMQRSLMGSLVAAFPQVQFVVATHSPFVVSSVKDSYVYVLRYDEELDVYRDAGRARVVSQRLDTVNKAGTASDILKTVLGVSVTLPIWAENELDAISGETPVILDNAGIRNLRHRLEGAGLGEFYPEALARIAQRQ